MMAGQVCKGIRGRLRNVPKNTIRAVSRGYAYCRHTLPLLIVPWANRVYSAARRMGRAIRAIWGRLERALKAFSLALSRGYPYYRHPLPIRVMHWGNVLFLAILLMSGLNIFSAHPALNWGKSSYRGVPPVFEIQSEGNNRGEISGVTRIFGRTFDTTGFLGASRDEDGALIAREFPSWLTIPDERWLAMARRWHFFFAWLLAINGIAFVTYSIARGHVRRDLVPTGKDLQSIARSILDHLRFRHPTGEAAKHYNVLQKLAYLGVVFLLLPLMILMGLGMSPALDALYPDWVDIFFGRQSMRTIHFVVALAILLFVFVHVFQVIVTGFWNNLRSMITGYYRVHQEADHG